MVRWSMLVGWYRLLWRVRGQHRTSRPEPFVLGNLNVGSNGHGHKALDPKAGSRMAADFMNAIEAGDVTKRHETTTWFHDNEDVGEDDGANTLRDEHLDGMQLL